MDYSYEIKYKCNCGNNNSLFFDNKKTEITVDKNIECVFCKTKIIIEKVNLKIYDNDILTQEISNVRA